MSGSLIRSVASIAALAGIPFAECGERGAGASAPVGSCSEQSFRDPDALIARPDVRARLTAQPAYPDVHAHAVTLREPNRAVIAVALGWEGPARGALLLFACDGRLLDAVPTAGIDGVRLESFDPPVPPALRIDYRVGGAASYRNEGIEMYGVRDSTLVIVWAGSTFEGDYGDVTREDSSVIVMGREGWIKRVTHRLPLEPPPPSAPAMRASAVSERPRERYYYWHTPSSAFRERE